MVVNWSATCCDPPAWWIMDWYPTYQPMAHDLCSQLQQMLRLSHTISAQTQHPVGLLDILLDHRDQLLKRSMCTSSNQCIKHQVYSFGFGVDCTYIKIIQRKNKHHFPSSDCERVPPASFCIQLSFLGSLIPRRVSWQVFVGLRGRLFTTKHYCNKGESCSAIVVRFTAYDSELVLSGLFNQKDLNTLKPS